MSERELAATKLDRGAWEQEALEAKARCRVLERLLRNALPRLGRADDGGLCEEIRAALEPAIRSSAQAG